MNVNSILDNLKSKGHKSTKVRQALVEILLSSNSPFSISDLLQELSLKKLNPNKTTVYREISFLKENDILEEIELGEGKKRYEISENHHHHIRCVSCKVIKDIPMEQDLNSKEQSLIKKMGFKPIGHSLEFFGLCKDCQKI